MLRVFAPENIEEGTGLFSSIITLQPHLVGSQGFYGAFWNLRTDHRTIIAYGYQGAMFQWIEEPSNQITHSPSIRSLTLKPFLSGHFAPVRVHFTRYGHLLLSSSHDRTVRVWGREVTTPTRWGEVSRPVMHGYPVTDAVTTIDHTQWEKKEGSEEEKSLLGNEEMGRLVTINEEKKCRVYSSTYLNLLLMNQLVVTADQKQGRPIPSINCA